MKTSVFVSRNEKGTSAYTLLEVLLMFVATMLISAGVFYFYQEYARNSRNAKRIGDMRFIETAIGIKQGQGASLMSLVGANVLQIPDAPLGGSNIPKDSGNYKAGTIDSEALGIDRGYLQDPLNGDYQLGVTTVGGGRYQMASIKEDSGEIYGYTYGNYTPRSRDGVLEGNFSNDQLIVSDSLGEFYVGDVVEDEWGFTGRILSIADDRQSLRFVSPATFSGSRVKLHLWLDESPGLIYGKDKAGEAGVVINGGNFFPFDARNHTSISNTELIHSLTP